MEAGRGSIDGALSRTMSALVFAPDGGAVAKAGYAWYHKRPIVTPEWLARSIASGHLLSFDDFAVPSEIMPDIRNAAENVRKESEKRKAEGADPTKG